MAFALVILTCETQLIHVLNDWTSAFESVQQVDVIYLDLQKALFW